MHPQSSVSYVGWFQSFFQAKHFGSVLALSLSLVLAACGGGGNTVTENDLVDPGADGVAPTLTSVSILQQQEKNSSPDGVAKLGQSIKVDFTASEALMLPVVTINGVEASLQGKIGDWSASREMVESDVEGYVTFNISFSDTSGEVGVDVSETTDDSRVQYCVEGCVAPVEDPLVGEWMLDGVGAAGVGPTAGSMEWFTTDADVVAARACWFDDSFVFGLDGSFSNEMGADTWVEAWQGGTDSCGAPVAPHDGTAAGTWVWDEAAGTLTINGKGAHLGLPKAVNGQELATPSAAPDSITYNILTLTADGMNLTVTVETAPGVWWTFNLAKKPVSPFVGTWKLDGAGAAGVGPTAGSMEWFTTDADVVAARACWFDDSFVFGADGSFSNEMGTETWVEAWQGGADSCGAPVAPHDGSAAATFSHNVEAGTVTINGLGAHLGLPKAVNGQELASPSAAPESITYNILTLTADGMNLTVTVETAPGVWWTFNLAKVPPSVLIGTWMLDGAGAAGVGPTAGSMEWFTTDADVVAARACWFDDSFVFGADGSFSNEMGTETWVEAWQGGADSCGAPVAPHDGSAAATFSHDVEAGTLTINGLGAHLGLPKAVNGQELATPSAAPESITYTILTLTADGMNLTVTVETAPGVWWTFNLAKVVPSSLTGTWKLDGAGAAGVGPTAGSMEWFTTDADVVAARACWFDDSFVFGAGGSFSNEMGAETWVEAWQGGTDSCGAPVAPHDGTAAATFSHDVEAGTLTINGLGAHLGLPKAVNGQELATPSAAPESITYTILTLTADGMNLTVTVETAPGVWWTFNLAKTTAVVTDPVDPVEPETGNVGTGDNNILDAGEVINFNSTTPGIYTLEDFGNNVSTLIADPTDATNTVVSVIKGNETWAGTTITSVTVIYPLTSTDTVMTVRVWSPEAGVTVRLKLEESGDPTHSVETDAVTTKAQEWETLTFDFSNQGEGTAELNTDYVFDKLSIFLNFGSVGSSETYYFDDVTFVGAATTDPVASAFAGPWGSFGGATADNDTSTYSVATGSESWAGFANENTSLYPFSFANGGTITFTGSVPSGVDVNVNFRFERLPHPDVDPSFNTDSVTVSGATEATYTVTIAAQDAANTFSSFLMYITTLDVDVVIKDVDVSENSAFAGPWGSFGGATADNDTSTYSVATGSESWAGFANENTSLYPFSFANGGTITFTGSVPSGVDVNVNFRFERLPHPDVDPSFNTDCSGRLVAQQRLLIL